MHSTHISYTDVPYTSAPNRIFLSRENLLHNYRYLQSLNPQIQIAPVLKSNAYGHGLVEIARILDTVHAPFFCVNSFSEAYTLYKNGIRTPLHIMGYVDPEQIKHERFPFSYTTYNYHQLEAINTYQPGSTIHIFVDTGMHREGFRLGLLPTLLGNLKQFPHLRITGFMSHFAQGENPTNQQTIMQLQNFQKAKTILNAQGIFPRYEHIAASAGYLNFAKNTAIGNTARIGKALYGVDPRGKNKELKPVLSLQTKVVQIKTLKKGDPIGYNATFVAKKKITIAVLPIGYADGLDRRLSNNGYTLVNTKVCPIVGRVSMNITTIDISGVPNLNVGHDVTVISSVREDKNSVESIALLCKTIPYDISAGLSSLLPREVV